MSYSVYISKTSASGVSEFLHYTVISHKWASDYPSFLPGQLVLVAWLDRALLLAAFLLRPEEG